MVSTPFSTAQEKRTMTHMAENAVFFHREFGIKAGFPALSRLSIQTQNPGIMAPAQQSRAIF